MDDSESKMRERKLQSIYLLWTKLLELEEEEEEEDYEVVDTSQMKKKNRNRIVYEQFFSRL